MPILFWHGLQEGPILDSFKQIVHEWNIEQSEYPIALKEFAHYGAPVEEALSAAPDVQPNLVLAPEFTTGKMMTALEQKKVIPISQFIDQELVKKVSELVKYTFGDKDGNLYALPFNPSCGVLYTNKHLLRAIGKDPNFVPQSMEELEDTCREMIAQGIVDHGYTTAWPAAYLIEVPAAQQDFPLGLPDNGRLGEISYQLGQKWLVNHFIHLKQQQKEQIYIYSGKDNHSRHPFINRKVAFYMQGSSHQSLLEKEVAQSDAPFEIGSGPLPTLTKGQTDKYAFPLGGASIWVLDNPTTRNRIDGVRAFLNYLASDELQERWHKETAYVPVLKTDHLALFHDTHSLHKAVIDQTISAPFGKYSFGVHASNYAEARQEMFDLIERILDIKTRDEEIMQMLEEFDGKFSKNNN